MNSRQGSRRGYQLAIFAPHIGVRSETFIQRHMRDLLPDETVAVVNTVDGPYAGHWSVQCPVLVLNRDGRIKNVVRTVGRKLGLQPADHSAIAKQFLQEHHVRVVMGEYLDRSLPWLGVVKDVGARFYAHAHGYDVSKRLRDSKWRADYVLYNQASGVITVSQASRQRLLQLGLDSTKVHVAPCGVEVPPESSRREPQETVRCLAVGRMVAKKAPIKTLEAFRQASQMCPELHLDYVGSGALFLAAQQFVRDFNLDDCVTLHGDQPNEVVHQLMSEADIFLQHSMTDPETGDEEGLPVAILEAMAHSLPVISTRHAGIPEAVFDGITGYLIEERDSAAMADRLISLSSDPDLRFQMGKAG